MHGFGSATILHTLLSGHILEAVHFNLKSVSESAGVLAQDIHIAIRPRYLTEFAYNRDFH